MKKVFRDVEKIQELVKEKEIKEQLTEKDAKELLEALQVSLSMNRAMVRAIKGGKDK